MNDVTAAVFGWLPDSHVEALREVVRGARESGVVATARSPLTLEEADKVLTELVAHRVKSKSHGNRLRV